MSTTSVPDLSIRAETLTPNPLDDLALVDRAGLGSAVAASDTAIDLDRVFGGRAEHAAATATPPRMAARPVPGAASALHQELPLFGPPIPDDEPLITKASPPRSPLAVRRGTPDVPRPRTEHARSAPLELELDLDASSAASHSPPATRMADNAWSDHRAYAANHRESASDDSAADAGIGARLVAVVIDLLILAVIDAVVVYFTMQICGISVEDLDILPKGPLLAFLLVQNGGYLVAFTAGGQTLGKMLVGIRVVPTDDEPSVDLGRAFLRTLMWFLLAIPAGLGFLTALFGPNHRGLHDRFAGTRVVRASA